MIKKSDHIANIADLREQLANEVRYYCRSQVAIWRTIPWLVIETEGRGGWSDSSWVARYGLYQLDSSAGCYTMHVDCSDGTLLHGLTPATDEQIIKISGNLAMLDAGKIVEYLRRKMNWEYSDGGSPKAHDAAKAQERRKYKVTPEYARTKPLPTRWDELPMYKAA